MWCVATHLCYHGFIIYIYIYKFNVSCIIIILYMVCMVEWLIQPNKTEYNYNLFGMVVEFI